MYKIVCITHAQHFDYRNLRSSLQLNFHRLIYVKNQYIRKVIYKTINNEILYDFDSNISERK